MWKVSCFYHNLKYVCAKQPHYTIWRCLCLVVVLVLYGSYCVCFSCFRYFSFMTQCKNPKACTILLRGASKDILNEVERNLQDALHVARNVVQDPRLVPGGGAAEMGISHVCLVFLLSLVQIVIYLNSTRKQELLNSILKTIFPKSALNSWYVREPLRNLLSLQRTIDSLFLEVTKTMETLERLRNWSRAYHELFLTLYLPKIESKSPKWKWPFPSAPRLPLYVLKHLWFCFRTEVFSCQVFLTSGT